MLSIVDGCTNTHTVLSIRLLKCELWRANVLPERTGRRSTVELAEIRVVHINEGAWDGSEFHIQVVSIYVTEVIEIWSTGVRQS